MLAAEQPSTIPEYGGRDDQPELVHEALLQQGTAELDASVHTDVAPGLLLEVADELRTEPSMMVVFAQGISGCVEVATYFWVPLMKLANGSWSAVGQ